MKPQSIATSSPALPPEGARGNRDGGQSGGVGVGDFATLFLAARQPQAAPPEEAAPSNERAQAQEAPSLLPKGQVARRPARIGPQTEPSAQAPHTQPAPAHAALTVEPPSQDSSQALTTAQEATKATEIEGSPGAQSEALMLALGLPASPMLGAMAPTTARTLDTSAGDDSSAATNALADSRLDGVPVAEGVKATAVPPAESPIAVTASTPASGPASSATPATPRELQRLGALSAKPGAEGENLQDANSASSANTNTTPLTAQSVQGISLPAQAQQDTSGQQGKNNSQQEREALAAPANASTHAPTHSLQRIDLGGLAAAAAPQPAAALQSPSAELPLPLSHPQFTQSLVSQISVWTQQGVHQAELRLNPAEMGPVQVRIRVDGDQAQVQFVAEAAPTRELLQNSLEQLGQALERDGLRWVGGDVQSGLAQQGQSGQRDGRPQAPGSSAAARRAGAQDAALLQAPLLRPPGGSGRSGLLDLYA